MVMVNKCAQCEFKQKQLRDCTFYQVNLFQTTRSNKGSYSVKHTDFTGIRGFYL